MLKCYEKKTISTKVQHAGYLNHEDDFFLLYTIKMAENLLDILSALKVLDKYLSFIVFYVTQYDKRVNSSAKTIQYFL